MMDLDEMIDLTLSAYVNSAANRSLNMRYGKGNGSVYYVSWKNNGANYGIEVKAAGIAIAVSGGVRRDDMRAARHSESQRGKVVVTEGAGSTPDYLIPPPTLEATLTAVRAELENKKITSRVIGLQG